MTVSREGREQEAFTLDDMAGALRGMPRDAVSYVGTTDGQAPIAGLRPTYVSWVPRCRSPD